MIYVFLYQLTPDDGVFVGMVVVIVVSTVIIFLVILALAILIGRMRKSDRNGFFLKIGTDPSMLSR